MNVPLFKQRKKTCGPTALKMVFKYFGKDVPIERIIKGVGGIKKYGVLTVKLAQFAQKSGFKVECLSYNKSSLLVGRGSRNLVKKMY